MEPSLESELLMLGKEEQIVNEAEEEPPRTSRIPLDPQLLVLER